MVGTISSETKEALRKIRAKRMTQEKIKKIDDVIKFYDGDISASQITEYAEEIFHIALQHLKESVEGENIDENGLKPCPFCGGKAEMVVKEIGYHTEFYGVTCSNYDYVVGDAGCPMLHQDANCEYKSDARKRWNTRPQSETLAKWMEE